MKRMLYLGLAMALFFVACTSQPTQQDDHSEETQGLENVLEEHDHADIKQELVAYTNEIELFAEADPFILNEGASILGHFTFLNNFKPLEDAEVMAILSVNGQSIKSAGTFVQAGIYEFDLHPETVGNGSLLFKIIQEGQEKQVQLNVIVFEDDHDAIEFFEAEEDDHGSGISFTKEQSWKVDFATALPETKPFGAVIKTTARVQPLPNKSSILTANTNGVVNYILSDLVEGKAINYKGALFSITGSGMGNDNASLVYASAQSNYEKEIADYQRVQKLAEKQIVSQKELLASKSSYEQTKAVYENLERNFNSQGQVIAAPFSGKIGEIFIRNGQYVNAGDPIASVLTTESVQLKADIQQKYATQVNQISEVFLRLPAQDNWIDYKEFNGKIISVGTQVHAENFLVPIYLEIQNNGEFFSGSFVELNLKTTSETDQVVIPNTALVEQQGNFFVFVQLNPELFEKRQLIIGDTDGLESVVKNGLHADERIVTKGAILVKLASASGNLDPHAGHVH